jgi:hypothetical protein
MAGKTKGEQIPYTRKTQHEWRVAVENILQGDVGPAVANAALEGKLTKDTADDTTIRIVTFNAKKNNGYQKVEHVTDNDYKDMAGQYDAKVRVKITEALSASPEVLKVVAKLRTSHAMWNKLLTYYTKNTHEDRLQAERAFNAESLTKKADGSMRTYITRKTELWEEWRTTKGAWPPEEKTPEFYSKTIEGFEGQYPALADRWWSKLSDLGEGDQLDENKFMDDLLGEERRYWRTKKQQAEQEEGDDSGVEERPAEQAMLGQQTAQRSRGPSGEQMLMRRMQDMQNEIAMLSRQVRNPQQQQQRQQRQRWQQGQGQQGFRGTCNNCGKVGHKQYQCWQPGGGAARVAGGGAQGGARRGE